MPQGLPQIFRNLEKIGHCAVDGHVMQERLKFYDAKDEDLERFQKLWSNGIGDDPVYGFRKTTQTRWHFNEPLTTATRLCPAPFKLNYSENSVLGDRVRNFPEASPEFVSSRVHHALVSMMRDVLKRMAATRGETETVGRRGYISGLHQFRICLAGESELADDAESLPDGTKPNCPTPEGVHQDGASVVIIVFIGAENMAPRSGESRIYDLAQPNGVMSRMASIEACETTRLAERNLVTPFESIILDDRAVKHDNRPLVAADASKPAHRDVLVMWAREFNAEDMVAPCVAHPSLPVTLHFPAYDSPQHGAAESA
jgi:hypothetical protein